MVKKISSAGPSITSKEIRLVNQAIRDGWQDKMNYYVESFVEEFSDYVGLKYCLTTSHCTEAIYLALLTLDIGAGDEVIVPDLTWVAAVSPIVHVGATPVFCDVDKNSFCLTAANIKKCITKKTKAIIGVDLLGNMPQWDEIIKLCKESKIHIIEDAAEGLGAKYKKKPAGNFGKISLFSFNATKLIMSGQGGAFCTNDENLYNKAKLLIHHGIDKKLTGKYYWSNIIGYNYQWTNLQAALALAQLRRINELLDYKKWLHENYFYQLSNIEDLHLNCFENNVNPSHWINAVVLVGKRKMKKEIVCEFFKKKNIDMRPMFYQVSEMPPFKKYLNRFKGRKNNANAHYISKYGVILPYGYNLSINDVVRICNVFKSLFLKKSK